MRRFVADDSACAAKILRVTLGAGFSSSTVFNSRGNASRKKEGEMSELAPSNDAVKRRADALEMRLRRVVALVAAVSGLCSLLPAALPEVPDVQALIGILEEAAPEALSDAQWLIRSFQQRASQLDAILLKSVA